MAKKVIFLKLMTCLTLLNLNLTIRYLAAAHMSVWQDEVGRSL
jgi:hypothetical protein